MKDEQIESFIRNTKITDVLPTNWKWVVMLALKYLLDRLETLETKVRRESR